jgi:hypothetical protein
MDEINKYVNDHQSMELYERYERGMKESIELAQEDNSLNVE